MPTNFARICWPFSFWNFSSAKALAAKMAHTAIAVATPDNRLLSMIFPCDHSVVYFLSLSTCAPETLGRRSRSFEQSLSPFDVCRLATRLNPFQLAHELGEYLAFGVLGQHGKKSLSEESVLRAFPSARICRNSSRKVSRASAVPV
jgi:hypothetical protein